jgi:hypothetical protein
MFCVNTGEDFLRCMRMIEVQEVLDVARQMLSSSQALNAPT